MPGVQKIQTFSAFKLLAMSTNTIAVAQNLDFFDQKSSALATNEWNDLNERGELPDGASGVLNRIFVGFHAQHIQSTAAATTANRQAWQAAVETLRMQAKITVSLSGVEIFEAPLWHCCLPAAWGTGAVPDAANLHANMQNGGYMLAFEAHPWHRDGRLQVNIRTNKDLVAGTRQDIQAHANFAPGIIVAAQVLTQLPTA